MAVAWREQRTSPGILRKGAGETRRAIERWLSRRPWAQPNRKGWRSISSPLTLGKQRP